MDRLTTISEITGMPILVALKESCGEDACGECCDLYTGKECSGCPVQDGITKLHKYEVLGFDPDELKKVLKFADACVRDSRPFEGDKIMIDIDDLRKAMGYPPWGQRTPEV